MTTKKIKQILAEIQLPKHCKCGHHWCNKCREWMMTHEERVALGIAIKAYLNSESFML